MNNPILYEQVKLKLNITWEDEETNTRVGNIIESAIPTLKHMLGITDENFDFATAGIENTLFLSYCLYEWNHCVNEFEENYKLLLATAKTKILVANLKAQEEAEDEADAE